ncbi:hypothetical protein FQN49_008770 [Arthroderma sp. PD_2]|nr:hypothetical protein FQN49_008770 [Arthroderma sp. PD_2]
MRFSLVSVLAVATLAMAAPEPTVSGSMSALPVTSSMVMTTAPYPTGGSPTGIPGTGTGSSSTHNTTSTVRTDTRTGSGPSSTPTTTSSEGLAATAGPAIAGVIGGAAVIAAFL